MKYNRRHPAWRQKGSANLLQALEIREKQLCSKNAMVLIFCLLLVIFYVIFYRENIEQESDEKKHLTDLNTISNHTRRNDFVVEELSEIKHKSFDLEAFTMAVDEEDIRVDLPDRLVLKATPAPECKDSVVFKNVTIIKNIDLNTTTLEDIYPEVKFGGHYVPEGCASKHKVAILVPYRNREDNLRMFLYNIHPFLKRQNIEYKIFVFEQSGTQLFNKGRLFNAGFLEIERMGEWQCVVFHDVDLLPTDDRIRYSCPELPRQLCAAIVDDESYGSSNKTRFSGVTAMTMWQYQVVNGYSNLYWGLGGEDDDMVKRLQASGLGMSGYTREIGRYISLSHPKSPNNNQRFRLLTTAVERFNSKIDGLTNLRYKKISHASHHLYTMITIDVNPQDDPNYVNAKRINMFKFKDYNLGSNEIPNGYSVTVKGVKPNEYNIV